MPLVNKQTKWRIHLFTAFLVITARAIRSVKYIQTEELEKIYIYIIPPRVFAHEKRVKNGLTHFLPPASLPCLHFLNIECLLGCDIGDIGDIIGDKMIVSAI